mgnify:FL=1
MANKKAWLTLLLLAVFLPCGAYFEYLRLYKPLWHSSSEWTRQHQRDSYRLAAHKDGLRHAQAGSPITANPYSAESDLDLFDAWVLGWIYGKETMRE